MRDTRSGVRTWMFASLALASGAVGCKTIAPSTGGSGGGNGSGSGGSGSGQDAGGLDVPMMPDVAMEHLSSGDAGDAVGDGICAATTSSAMLVPLDLYVMMDSSKSMNETDSMGTDKWTDLKNAMSSFFNDANSKSFNVALSYFPDEQGGVPEVCNTDADCTSGTNPCDQRKACVAKAQFSMAPSTLCTKDADCVTAGDGDSCVPIQKCPVGPNCQQRSCVAGPSSTTSCPTGCTPYTGYCRGRDICQSDDYATPKVPFGSLSDSSVVSALTTSLANHSPSGFTPTGPALTGALKAAQQNAIDHPDHKTVIVLVTDGLPGSFIPCPSGMTCSTTPTACSPPDVAGVANLLATGAMGMPTATPPVPPIQTFVIGIFGPCDLTNATMNPQTNLDSWAMSGGTSKSVIVDTSQDVTQKISDALKEVQSTVITCQYAIPKNVAGGIEFSKVNVEFSSSAMNTPSPVHYVGAKDKCDSTTGGWYYDVSPDPPTSGTPTQIIACDASCATFKATDGAKVDIALGCATIN
ncbi:MAG TPA: hypothetical protein VGP07_06750 [Polyangia bacterium]